MPAWLMVCLLLQPAEAPLQHIEELEARRIASGILPWRDAPAQAYVEALLRRLDPAQPSAVVLFQDSRARVMLPARGPLYLSTALFASAQENTLIEAVAHALAHHALGHRRLGAANSRVFWAFVCPRQGQSAPLALSGQVREMESAAEAHTAAALPDSFLPDDYSAIRARLKPQPSLRRIR